MRPPDFVGIGFRRCSTSWLHRCLNEHPEVGKTPGGIHYFSEHLDRGDEWYLQQFVPFADKKVVLDFSVSYAYPENIQKFVEHIPRLLPQAGVFAVVRHPVDRAYSDYRMSIFIEELSPDTTFEQALEQMPVLLERGRYGFLLQQVLEVIPESRLKIFFYDDVKSQPEKFWREVCEFLNVSASFTPSVLHTPLGHLAPPKHPGIHRLLRRINRAITAAPGVGRYWQLFKRTTAWRKLLAMDVKKAEGVQVETRRMLLDYYADDINFLTRLTGRDLSGWFQ